jgi:superfamily II DNA or RNA helicase
MKKTKESKRDSVQQSALEVSKKARRCGLALSMGVGKTYIGLQHMDWYLREVNPDARFLVVAPKKTIFSSWFDDMFKFGMPHLKDRVVVTTYLSLSKQALNYDVLYLDECHSLLFTHDLWLSSFSGRIIGLTGTPPRNAYGEKGTMVNKYCPIIFNYVTDAAVDDRILNDYRIKVHVLDLDKRKNYKVVTKNLTFNTSEYENYEYWSNRIMNSRSATEDKYGRISRMRAMMTYPSKETYVKKLMEEVEGKCLIFCNTQEQADRICSYSFHSQNPESDQNLQMFKDGTIKRLSCVLQLNEGINIPDLRNIIIMHSYGNERKTAQRLGRALRLSPDQVATVHILMYSGTMDTKWVKTAIEDFDEDKIEYYDPRKTQVNVYNNPV